MTPKFLDLSSWMNCIAILLRKTWGWDNLEFSDDIRLENMMGNYSKIIAKCHRFFIPSPSYACPLPYVVMVLLSEPWLVYVISFSQWEVSRPNQAEILKVLLHFHFSHVCILGMGTRTYLKYPVSGWDTWVLPNSLKMSQMRSARLATKQKHEWVHPRLQVWQSQPPHKLEQ